MSRRSDDPRGRSARPFDPRLLRALPATRGPVALLSVLGVLGGVTAVAQAVVLALLVAQVVGGGPLGPVLAGLVALLILRGALAGAGEYVARRAGQRVSGQVRLAVLRRWSARPEEERPPTDVALTRATDGVSALEPYVARYLPALVTAAVVPVLAVVVLAVVDVWSALIVVLTLPLLPVFAALVGQHTQEQTERRWGAMAQLAGHFLDVVRGLPTLVAYGRARHQVAVVREVGERHRAATTATLRTAFLSTAALELLATISVALVAVAVGLRLAYGAMDLSVGLVAILLAPEAYWPVRRVGAEFHNAADGSTALAELAADGVLDVDPAPAEDGREVDAQQEGTGGTQEQGPAERVGLHALSYAHRGRSRTLVDVDLSTTVAPGLTALTGPSGAGKTTVLELLAGLRVPTAGSVTAPRAHLASQRPVLLPGTVRDNLLLVAPGLPTSGPSGLQAGPRVDDRDGLADDALVDALRRVGLWDDLEDRDGLDTDLGEDGFGLSAGQRARLALARALLSDGPLVLLDEPTANVAAGSVPLLHGVVLDLAAHRRVVAVTHDPDLVALADDHWHLEPAPLEDRGTAPRLHTTRAAPVAATARGARTARDRSGSTSTDRTLPVPDAGSASADGPADDHDRIPLLRAPRGRAGLAAACLLGGLSVGAGVALTATSGWLIVQASTQPVVLTLMVAIVGVRAFGLARPVLRYAERVLSHDVALADLADRRAEVFARLVPLTPARLGRRSRGELLTAVVRDLDDVVDEQVRVTVPAWSTVIATVVGALVAGWHLPVAGLVVALGGLLVLGVGATGYAAERAAQGSVVAARGRVRHTVTALISRLLQVQATTGLHADRTRLLLPVVDGERDQLRAESRLAAARGGTMAALWLVVAGTTAAVAVLVAAAHSGGDLSGPYAALVALVPMALADAWLGLADVAGARARARAAAARLVRVLDQEPAVAGRGRERLPAGAPTEVRWDGVGARWPAHVARAGHECGVPAPGVAAEATAPGVHVRLDLPPTDLDLPAGERMSLTGPNGTGKSTALAVLARHLDPEVGQATVAGTDLLDLDLEQTRSRIALVDDEPHAFAGSVRANLALAAPHVDDAAMRTALRTVDLGHWFSTLPQGLDTPLTGLSGGERARLSMARALLADRPLVLLDEPTAHLDDATAERALTGLDRQVGAAATVVAVSHRPVGPARDWPQVRPGGDRLLAAAQDGGRPVH
ncbi:thiol reductant ABC exporter subunit CydC [Ornithinimicrobium sp. W1679]|uniref:thiol reductant ABC exporter subunit CydC n=1 Tax=Ornithinimicrobium sp. W1679 TaxID=3418770 RepID=UPI003CF67780